MVLPLGLEDGNDKNVAPVRSVDDFGTRPPPDIFMDIGMFESRAETIRYSD